MQVIHILFLVWAVVFAFWLFGQFSKSNTDYDQKTRR
jgi:hypothetical protein